MLTLKLVEKQIEDLIRNHKHYPDGDKDRRKAEREVSLLRTVKLYLENNPSQEWLEKEVFRIETLLEKIAAGFKTWAKNNPREANETPNPLSVYNRLMGTATLKRHLKGARYILQSNLRMAA